MGAGGAGQCKSGFGASSHIAPLGAGPIGAGPVHYLLLTCRLSPSPRPQSKRLAKKRQQMEKISQPLLKDSGV